MSLTQKDIKRATQKANEFLKVIEESIWLQYELHNKWLEEHPHCKVENVIKQ